MSADHPQYEYTSVQAIRGTEARTIAKWQNDGWELDTRGEGSLLRTELTFRRVKPKTLGGSALAAFRRLEPTAQRGLLAGAAGLVLIAVVGGVVAGVQSGDGVVDTTASAAEFSAAPSAAPSGQDQAAADSASVPAPSAADESLTVQNNEDLAALVATTAPSVAEVEEFAATYRGRTIEFDGNIAHMNPHGDYTTRYDLLIFSGDYSATSSTGPNMQFRDVNIVNDLHLTGPNIPDTIGIGDNLRVVARVGDYNSTQELLFLEPISTEVR
ncbi:DUF4839 domain-containing protein [Blastococcus sp. SYSU DS0619]